MMYYSVMTQVYSEKEIPSSPNRNRTYDSSIGGTGLGGKTIELRR